VKKQKATGRTRDGATFPLCLRISEQTSEDKGMDNVNNVLYSVVIWVSVKCGKCNVCLHCQCLLLENKVEGIVCQMTT
jgi:hypothetical protein